MQKFFDKISTRVSKAVTFPKGKGVYPKFGKRVFFLAAITLILYLLSLLFVINTKKGKEILNYIQNMFLNPFRKQKKKVVVAPSKKNNKKKMSSITKITCK